MSPKEVPLELKEYICSGVKLIMGLSELTDEEKKFLLPKVLGLGAGASWQPIKITRAALQLFVDNDFNKPKGLERAHIEHRRDTLKELFRAKWKEDWWDWYKERDYTILATRTENRDEKNLPMVEKIDIPKDKKLFWGKRVGFEYGEAEIEFIKSAAKAMGIKKGQ